MRSETFFPKITEHLSVIPEHGTVLFLQSWDELRAFVRDVRPDIRQTEYMEKGCADAIYIGTALEPEQDLESTMLRMRDALKYGGPVFALIVNPDATGEQVQGLGRLFAAAGFESIAAEVLGSEVLPEGWLVTASFMDAEERRLCRGISKEGCVELAHALCRVENDIESAANAERILALCGREHLDFDFLQAFAGKSVLHPEQTIQKLACALEGSA